MSAVFMTRMSALYDSCELPPPRLDGESEINLALDGERLRIFERDDGNGVLIVAPIGGLAMERGRRSDQVREILSDGLALAGASLACVALARERGEPPFIEAIAVHDYADSLTSLQRAIEDVLGVGQRLRTLLDARSATARRLTPGSSEGLDVIFQP